MNLPDIIDILIYEVYNKKSSNCAISRTLEDNNINIPKDYTYVVRDKIDELDIFRTIDISTAECGADYLLYPNAQGLEFFEKHINYTQFLHKKQQAQKADDKNTQELYKWNIRDAKGSFIGGIFIALASFLFNIFQYYDSNNKDKKIKTLQNEIDSIKKTNSPIKLSDTLSKLPQIENPKQTNDTLKRTTNQAL